MAAWNLIERLKSVTIGIVNETLASGVRVDTVGINACHKKPVGAPPAHPPPATCHLLTCYLVNCLPAHMIFFSGQLLTYSPGHLIPLVTWSRRK